MWLELYEGATFGQKVFSNICSGGDRLYKTTWHYSKFQKSIFMNRSNEYRLEYSSQPVPLQQHHVHDGCPRLHRLCTSFHGETYFSLFVEKALLLLARNNVLVLHILH